MNSRKSDCIVSATFLSTIGVSLFSVTLKPCLRVPLLTQPPTPAPTNKFPPSTTQSSRRKLTPRFPPFPFFFLLYFISYSLPRSFFSQEDDAPIVEDVKDDDKEETEDEDEDDDDDDKEDDAQGPPMFLFVPLLIS